MAPPIARRSSFSKRAQYGTFLGYIAAIVGMLTGAGVLIFAFMDKDAFSDARGFAADLAAPVGSAVATGRSSLHNFGSLISGYVTSGPENARMRRELAVARVRLAEARALAEENRNLKALLGLRAIPDQPAAFARFIASTASSTRRFGTISAGTAQGVAVGMPVRTPLGLVGRVVEVSRSTARVLLITDTESTVPIQRARDGIPAFAEGHGDGTLQIRLVSLGINPLKPGDVFVTSGSGGLYAPGTAVAAVMQTNRDGAIARVLSDPSSVDYVAVYPVFAQSVGMNEVLVDRPAAPIQPVRHKGGK